MDYIESNYLNIESNYLTWSDVVLLIETFKNQPSPDKRIQLSDILYQWEEAYHEWEEDEARERNYQETERCLQNCQKEDRLMGGQREEDFDDWFDSFDAGVQHNILNVMDS